MKKKHLFFILIITSLVFGSHAQTSHLDGETKLVNPTGRTLLIERDDEDSYLTFHDPGQHWFSFGIDRSNNGTLSLNSGGTLNSSQFVMLSNGNVGIGTSIPGSKLDVYGTIRSSSSSTRFINLLSNGDGNSYVNFVGGASNSRIGFQIDGGSKMSIMNDGTVGIGTTTTGSHKLAVEGSIGAREVKVQAGPGWPDYVFEEDYNLPPLEEVETYISENKHLPEIPSAAEVTENGIYLGEMNAKLLQKVEELTLYLIEQNKQNQAQQAEIEVLKAKMNQLENQ